MFRQTAHAATSAEATARSIKGRFSAGHDVLRTRLPGISFKMEERNGAFYQTGVDSAQRRSITKRIELVVGSGRRGQSYLYWAGGLLFELPVSYLTGPEQWVNSPGYSDGEIDFGRLIVPPAVTAWASPVKNVMARGENTSTFSRRIPRRRAERPFSIPRVSRGTEGWIIARCAIPGSGSHDDRRSHTGRVRGSTTISSLDPTPMFPFRTCMVIRWGCCGAASAFARAGTCPVRLATTSIDRNETSRGSRRSVWRVIRRANIRWLTKSQVA